MEDAVLAIADAFIGGGRHGRAAHAVRCRRDIEQYFGEAAAGDSADGLGTTGHEIIRFRNEGGNALALSHQRLAEWPIP